MHPVENSSRMGFIFSSLHKHNLILVIKYSSFTLVTTLQFSTHPMCTMAHSGHDDDGSMRASLTT